MVLVERIKEDGHVTNVVRDQTSEVSVVWTLREKFLIFVEFFVRDINFKIDSVIVL